jgi:hypothetical protein
MKAGAYPRWISIEIHNYSKDGHKLTNLLAQHGYVLRGIHALADESTLSAFRAGEGKKRFVRECHGEGGECL